MAHSASSSICPSEPTDALLHKLAWLFEAHHARLARACAPSPQDSQPHHGLAAWRPKFAGLRRYFAISPSPSVGDGQAVLLDARLACARLHTSEGAGLGPTRSADWLTFDTTRPTADAAQETQLSRLASTIIVQQVEEAMALVDAPPAALFDSASRMVTHLLSTGTAPLLAREAAQAAEKMVNGAQFEGWLVLEASRVRDMLAQLRITAHYFACVQGELVRDAASLACPDAPTTTTTTSAAPTSSATASSDAAVLCHGGCAGVGLEGAVALTSLLQPREWQRGAASMPLGDACREQGASAAVPGRARQLLRIEDGDGCGVRYDVAEVAAAEARRQLVALASHYTGQRAAAAAAAAVAAAKAAAAAAEDGTATPRAQAQAAGFAAASTEVPAALELLSRLCRHELTFNIRKQHIVASLLELQRVAIDANDAAGISQMIVDLIASRPRLQLDAVDFEESFASENRALQLWQGLLTRVLGMSLAAGRLAAEQRRAAADELWLRGNAWEAAAARAVRRLDVLVRSTVQSAARAAKCADPLAISRLEGVVLLQALGEAEGLPARSSRAAAAGAATAAAAAATAAAAAAAKKAAAEEEGGGSRRRKQGAPSTAATARQAVDSHDPRHACALARLALAQALAKYPAAASRAENATRAERETLARVTKLYARALEGATLWGSAQAAAAELETLRAVLALRQPALPWTSWLHLHPEIVAPEPPMGATVLSSAAELQAGLPPSSLEKLALGGVGVRARSLLQLQLAERHLLLLLLIAGKPAPATKAGGGTTAPPPTALLSKLAPAASLVGAAAAAAAVQTVALPVVVEEALCRLQQGLEKACVSAAAAVEENAASGLVGVAMAEAEEAAVADAEARVEESHQAVVAAGLLAHHGKSVDALDGARHCLEAARMSLSCDEARHTQQRRAECAGLVREMERELVRLKQLADDVHKVSVVVPQRHEVEAEVQGLREARAAGRAPPEPVPGQLELHMVTEPAVRAHHKQLTNDVWQFVALSRLAAAARRARSRIGERASGPPSFALQVASISAEEEAARLVEEAKVDYLDEAEAAAAAELKRRERHCLVDMCEDEAAQHERLRRVQAEFAELEIQRAAQARVGERLETRHLDMLYWKVRHRHVPITTY